MNDGQIAQPYAGLRNEELTQRVCLLDLIEETVELSDGSAEDIEDRLGMLGELKRVHELSDEQLKEKVDEELKRRTAHLRAEIADDFLAPEQRNDELAERALMLETIEGLEAEDREEREELDWPTPTIREAAHDLTNEQLRQRLDECLRIRVETLRTLWMQADLGKVSRTIN